jgi:hypothetical protein
MIQSDGLMDLLEHYDSSSSDGDDKSQKPQDCSGSSSTYQEKRPTEDCTNGTTGHHDSNHRHKRPRGSVTIVSDRDAASQSLFVRAKPHVRGNWAGHVFVRIPISSTTTTTTVKEEFDSSSSEDESDTDSSWQAVVNDSVATFRNDLERAGYTGTLVQHEHCHLSLSRPFYLQVASIDSFVEKLTERLQLCPVTTIRILASNNYNSSANKFSSNILVNDDQTRSFWTWPVAQNAALLQIVQSVNAVLQSYNQPVYYDPPHFHVSLASFVATTTATTTTTSNALTSVHQDLPKRVQELATQTSRSNDNDVDDVDDDKEIATTTTSTTSAFCFPWTISEIQCTFGTTKSYMIPLTSSR